MGANCKTNMVGIFDFQNDIPIREASNARNKDIIDAPLLLGIERLQQRYHAKANRNTSMAVSIRSPDFKELMKKFGKKQKAGKGINLAAPISIYITNWAARKSSENEKARGFGPVVYYAKFIEYGYFRYVGVLADGSYKNRRDQTAVKSVPKFIPGKRFFSMLKDKNATIIKNALKKMPYIYDRESVFEAMENASQSIAMNFEHASARMGKNQDYDKRTITKFTKGWEAMVKDHATGKTINTWGERG